VTAEREYPDLRDKLFFIGATLLLFTFAVSAGYQYRWIFVLMVLPALLERESRAPMRQARVRGVAKAVAVACGLFVMWYTVIGNVAVVAITRVSDFQTETLSQLLAQPKNLAAWTFFAALSMELAFRTRVDNPVNWCLSLISRKARLLPGRAR
jgi:hypothetical protein